MELARMAARDATVLDLACGDGYLARRVSPIAHRVIGLDLSSKMLGEARSRSALFDNVHYLRATMTSLGAVLRPRSVDCCLAVNALCCASTWAELAATFQGISAVLRPGGTFIVQVPHPMDGLFREDSAWLRDVDPWSSYFDSETLVRRRLRTVDDKWLLVARYHYPIGDYYRAITEAGLRVTRLVEPMPSEALLLRFPSLRRETRLPSCLIFAGHRPGGRVRLIGG
jgi:SAM-dependent methyltransferase